MIFFPRTEFKGEGENTGIKIRYALVKACL